MNKDDWIWVAIRVFGIYLIVEAIILLPFTGASLYLFLNAPESMEAAGESMKMARILSEANKGVVKTGLVKGSFGVIIYFLFGLYFVRGGRIVHGLISNFGSGDDDQEEVTMSDEDNPTSQEEDTTELSGHSE